MAGKRLRDPVEKVPVFESVARVTREWLKHGKVKWRICLNPDYPKSFARGAEDSLAQLLVGQVGSVHTATGVDNVEMGLYVRHPAPRFFVEKREEEDAASIYKNAAELCGVAATKSAAGFKEKGQVVEGIELNLWCELDVRVEGGIIIKIEAAHEVFFR